MISADIISLSQLFSELGTENTLLNNVLHGLLMLLLSGFYFLLTFSAHFTLFL